jgi:hypothetical protein
MSQKRAPMSLDAAAFAGVAVPQPDPVQAAVAKVTPPTTPPVPKAASARESPPLRAARATKSESRANAQKSRVGRVPVQTWIPEEKRRSLKVLSAKTGISVEDYLENCIDDLLKRHPA